MWGALRADLRVYRTPYEGTDGFLRGRGGGYAIDTATRAGRLLITSLAGTATLALAFALEGHAIRCMIRQIGFMRRWSFLRSSRRTVDSGCEQVLPCAIARGWGAAAGSIGRMSRCCHRVPAATAAAKRPGDVCL